jgi:hypothetical protein
LADEFGQIKSSYRKVEDLLAEDGREDYHVERYENIEELNYLINKKIADEIVRW